MQQSNVQTGRADDGHAHAAAGGSNLHGEHGDTGTHHPVDRNQAPHPSLCPPRVNPSRGRPSHEQSTDDSEAQGNQRPAKRRRVALACDLCRQRKVRCDGAKPVCTPCQKRGEPPLGCAYNTIPQSAKHLEEKRYITSLQTQIHQLNRALNHSKVPAQSLNESQVSEAHHTEDAPARDSDDSPRATSRSTRKSTNSSVSTTSPYNVLVTNPEVTSRTGYERATSRQSRPDNPAQSLHLENAQYVTAKSVPSLVTAMGATSVDQAYTSAASTGSNEFYGKSSVHSLLQEVSGGSHHRSSVGVASSKGHEDISLISARYALPPRQIADELLHLYFTNVHIFYPWTHSTNFLKRYESLWSREGYNGYVNDDPGDLGLGGNQCPASVFFCALNAMFALGSEFSSSQSRISASEIFYARMQEFLYSTLLDHPDLANVQAMLLAGYYLLTTELPSTCYIVVGTACRVAVGLGMHSDKNSTRYTAVEKELRRRLWYGCLQMEMTVSMTLGRPPLLQMTDAVPLPMAIDDEFLLTASDTIMQPDHIISKTLYMVENVKLVKILAMILNQVYTNDPRPALDQLANSAASSTDLSTLIQIGDALQDFEVNLPAPLQCRTENNHDNVPVISILERQGNVLHARVLHLRILLYRPLFSMFCSIAWRNGRGQDRSSLNATGLTDGRPSSQCLSVALQEQCARSCLQSAYELARSIHTGILRGLPSAWWFSSFYLVTCGGIALLAESANRNAKCFEQQLVDSTWNDCAAALRHIGASHARTAGYLDHLIRLRERVRSGIMPTWPSGTTTRRPSADQTGAGDVQQDSHDVGTMNDQDADPQDFTFAGVNIFDNWDWHLDTSLFGLGDDMNFPLTAFI